MFGGRSPNQASMIMMIDIEECSAAVQREDIVSQLRSRNDLTNQLMFFLLHKLCKRQNRKVDVHNGYYHVVKGVIDTSLIQLSV